MQCPRIIWLTPDRFDLKQDKSSWLEMGRCLTALGWDVVILASGKTQERSTRTDPFDGLVQYVRAVDIPFLFRITVLIAMARWMTRHARAEDTVVLNQDSLWLVPVFKHLGIRFVHLDFRTLPVDVHGFKRRIDWLLFWRLPIRLFARSVDGYSFITERLREEVEREFAIGASDYAIWQSAVDLRRFGNASPQHESKGASIRLFYHGAVTRKRGLGLVIDALALGGLPPALDFEIVGDGPDRKDLEVQVERLGLRQRVRFRGFVRYDSIASEVAQADICICPLPDRLEWNVSSPLKIFEYMACAKPMVLTPIPAHLDVLAGCPFVVWTRGYSPEDFRDAIAESVRRLDEITSAAKSAPGLARGRFEWHVQAGKLDAYLERMLNRSNELRKGQKRRSGSEAAC
jgi:glycosyltransferase involved in cell wall biosynthesis